MRNRIALISVGLLLTLATTALAELHGTVTVAFGKVRQTDGTWKDISGMKLPVTIRPIKASRIDRVHEITFEDRFPNRITNPLNDLFQTIATGSGPEADFDIYKSDDGVNYGFAEQNPSSLDGLTISNSGVDKPWKTLGFAFNYGRPQYRDFLIRWRIYEINTENPPGQSDFTQEFADFGVIWNIPISGSNYVEIDVQQAQVNAPSTSMYMAQQFRDTSDLINGNGPFEFGVDTVFSPVNPPSIGSSEEHFWYDGGGLSPDGIYENSEVDVFENLLANHTYRIVVSDSSSVQNALPIIVNTVQGYYVDGDFTSLWFIDNSDYTLNPNYNVDRTTFPSIVEITAQGPAGPILGLRAIGRTRTSINDVDQKIEFWDYVNREWVLVHQSIIGTPFQVFDALYGGTVPLNNFKEAGTNRLKARIHFRNRTDNIGRSWTADIDQFIWRVTTP